MQTIERTTKKHKLLRYLRLLNSMTISELAYKAKVNFTHLEEIENGTRLCSELTARRLASYFDMPKEWEQFYSPREED